MAQNFSDPLFAKVFKTLSGETQDCLKDNGLDNPGVFESFLGDPDVRVEDLASTPSVVPGLTALLKEASRAVRSKSAEFASRPMADLLRSDSEEKTLSTCLPKEPTELQLSSRGSTALSRAQAAVLVGKKVTPGEGTAGPRELRRGRKTQVARRKRLTCCTF